MVNIDRLLDNDTLTPEQEKHFLTTSYYKDNSFKLTHYASLDETNQKRDKELRKDLTQFLRAFLTKEVIKGNKPSESVNEFETELNSMRLTELYQTWSNEFPPTTLSSRSNNSLANLLIKVAKVEI